MWRAATSEDDDAIVRLSLALFTEDPSPEVITEESVRRTLERFRAEPLRGEVMVLDVDGRIAGYVFLPRYWSNELGGEICIVDELYVEAASRNRGHASELLRTLRGNAVALELEVTPKNIHARALYERLGFRMKKNTVLRKRFES